METSGKPSRFVVAIHKTPAGYYARVLNVPGCIAKGDSEVEAIENARSAIRTFLAVARLIEQDKARVSLEISA
jgi:predicted RNase H-like HicB family nuclease